MRRYKFIPGVARDSTGLPMTFYQAICSMNNLEHALHNAARGKRKYPEVQRVLRNPMMYLKMLQKMLKYHTYQTSKYTIFEKKEGNKMRTIAKLPFFPDRIAQWAIVQVIGYTIENTLICDTYSSMAGRGPLKCMNKVYKCMHYDPEETRYCLKIDIHHFYQSIDRDLLKRKYRNLFKDEELLHILNEIIDSYPGETGIPIGNFISQYSANFYLSRFDHYIKEFSGVKHYFRYMDDMVFFSKDRDFLLDLLEGIKCILEHEEKLTLKENYVVFDTYDRGVDFVGFVITHDYVRIRKCTRMKYRYTMKSINHALTGNQHMFAQFYSYKGFLQHCNSYNLQKKYSNNNVRGKLEIQDFVYETRRLNINTK